MEGFKERSFNFLIADDDLDDHFILKRTIEQLNLKHSCNSVYNGLELMDFLEKAKFAPDLIILDLNMPLLDGFGALEKIKAKDSFRNIPVFVLSTTHFDYDEKKAIELGASFFYRKPVQYDRMRDIVEDMLLKSSIQKTPAP